MLAVSTAFKAFLFNTQRRTPLVRAHFENTGVDSTHGLESFDLEFTEFITSFGQVTRELNLEHGVFRAGSNTLVLKNSKDFGDYLFSLRRRFGDAIWNDKTYHLLFGFREFPTTASMTGGTPKVSTLGFGGLATQALPTSSPVSLGLGDTPAGEPSVDSATEETTRLYTGDIQEVIYDRVNCEVKITSKDFYQRLVDYKICRKQQAATDTTDTREIQMVLKYGTHKLITRPTSNTTANNSSITDRNNPFSATICYANLNSKSVLGVTYASNFIWIPPILNSLTTSGYATGALKLYYWDYMARIWRAFPASYFTSGYIQVRASTFYITSSANCKVGPSLTDSWAQYLAGAGGSYFLPTTDTGKIDIAVCAESTDGLTDSNPIRIIYDLLHSQRFLDIEDPLTGLIDYYSFTTPDVDYSFDEAFKFYDTEGVEINVSQTSETSIAKVIENICSLVGAKFYITAFRGPDERRAIRVKVDRVHNPCAEKPPYLIHFSTRDRLIKYETVMDKDEYYTGVNVLNFEPAVSTRENYDMISYGSGNRIITLGSKDYYFYGNNATADGIAARLYNKFSKPAERVEIETDASGIVAEIADYIQLHDHRLDDTIVAEVFRHQFDLNNKVRMTARRYQKLYGPDELRPYKVYAFCGCARAGTNAEAGSGSHASITIGDKTVTLTGETLDTALVKVGMAIRVEDEIFWIASITSATELEVETAAVAGHSDKTWSIGKSYHAR